MKTLKNIAMAIGLTAVLGSATLSAQNGSKATIPFDFQITGMTLPSGEYTVRLTTRIVTCLPSRICPTAGQPACWRIRSSPERRKSRC